jgi:N utilization substance protein A
MNAEFFSAIADIEKEKGIPQSYMLEKIEQALLAALKKDSPLPRSVRASFGPGKEDRHMFLAKTVADPVTDPIRRYRWSRRAYSTPAPTWAIS